MKMIVIVMMHTKQLSKMLKNMIKKFIHYCDTQTFTILFCYLPTLNEALSDMFHYNLKQIPFKVYRTKTGLLSMGKILCYQSALKLLKTTDVILKN
jgi:hypothetical protein